MVAAAIRVAMIHSSSRSRMRSSTTGNRSARRRREARCLVDLFDKVLAEAALHLGVNRHQLGDPGLTLIRGEHVELQFAGRLDLLQRVGVVLGGGLVEEI